MTFDSDFLTAIARIGIAALTALLGVAVLFRGRKLLWLFSGAAAFLLGILLARILDFILGGRLSDTKGLSWIDLIPIAAGVLGVLAGRFQRRSAYAVIGLSAGGTLAIWVAQVILQVEASTDFWLDFWSAVVVLIVMGLGMLFVIHYGDVALIILSAGVGVSLIVHGLALPLDSQIVAALSLAAGIASLVIQYHDYLVELRAAHNNEAPGLDGTTGTASDEAGVSTLPAN